MGFFKQTALFLIIASLLLPGMTFAQRARKQAEVPPEFLTGPHIGTAEQALVGIEVTNRSTDGAASRTRRGNGVVIRCDGFILAPSKLFDGDITVAGQSERAGSQSISVILYPGTEREKRVNGARPRFISKEVGYVAFKLDGVHVPAVRTLLPDTLKANDAIQLVFSDWDAAAKHFGKPVYRTVKLGTPPTEEDVKAKSGYYGFAEPVENVAGGAVVVGPDGMGIGLVAGTGTVLLSEGFLSFSVLNLATNCVSALPIPDSAFAPANAAPGGAALGQQAGGAMVHVPGGPIRLPSNVMADQPDMGLENIACVAPFDIDKFEVTNKEYLAFWLTLPQDKRRQLWFQNHYFPSTWSKNGPPFPSELENNPVLGVALPGATAYARAQGKRLPTPYEWCLAAFGSEGEASAPSWMGEFINDRRANWYKIADLHDQYLRMNQFLLQVGGERDAGWLPWVMNHPLWQPAGAWSKRIVEQMTESLWTRWRDPVYVLPVGSRDFDVSPYGAADMILNGNEIIQPFPGPPVLGKGRYMHVEWIQLKPKPTDPWIPRKAQLLTDEQFVPPLSRLFRRSFLSPQTEDLVAWSNVGEAVSMLAPLAGWELQMTSETMTTAAGMTVKRTGLNGLSAEVAGLRNWQSMPKHYRVEVGNPVPLDHTEHNISTGPQLMYYLPNGFRCAR
jgi:formylglycine-generating enzyme required for sulfatase activity